MRLLLTFLLFTVGISAAAQEVVVLERGTNIPLSYVAIYNKDKSVSTFTGSQGTAELSKFSASEQIVFRHISHYEFTTTKAGILASGGKVYLTVDENSLQELVLSGSRSRQKKKEVPQKTLRNLTGEISVPTSQTS